MASSKPQILTFCGTFYLPVVSLAMLAGFVVSLTLPVALSFSISAMDSALFGLLPQLWHAFRSWITPPCLFVVLNSIIFVLTASSGMLSSSASSSGSSDFYANLLGKVESPPKQISEALIEDLSAVAPSTNLPAKVQQQSFRALVGEAPAFSTRKPCPVFDAHGTCRVQEEGKFYDAEDDDDGDCEVEEEKEEKEEEEVEKEEKQENFFNNSKLVRGSRSFSFSFAQSRINEDEEEDDNEVEYLNAGPSYGYSKQAIVNKKMPLSFLCREEEDFVQLKGRSVPSSPQYTTLPKRNSITRSLSVDSASFHGNQASRPVPSAESLSDEAFKKRVEDFISRMNAQLRNEVK